MSLQPRDHQATSLCDTGARHSDPFRGVSAFPLSPVFNGAASGRLDETSFVRLVERAAAANVSSIAVLGSTGSYMYLSAAERERLVRLAVEHSAGVPVLAGVGAIATDEVLVHLRAAEAAGAQGLIVAPVSYQRLSDDEVFQLYRDVTEAATVPIVVYDNPGTTGFTFSLELYARVAALPKIASIKVPPPPAGLVEARAYVDAIRAVIPEHVTVGVSGDASAALGLAAGCDAWYSVIAGVLPESAMELASEAVRARDASLSSADSTGTSRSMAVELAPVFDLFGEFGSLRVAAAVAEELGLVEADCLPRPVLGLATGARAKVRTVLRVFNLVRALGADDARARLETAMAMGTDPEQGFVRPLITRLGVEPDFQVREMLTWALVRHGELEPDHGRWSASSDNVVTLLLEELNSPSPLARAQSLHTLTKLGMPEIWPHITPDLLHDDHDEAARTAWRAAAQLWPAAEHLRLAGELTSELGRGELEVLRSLARAFVQLGDHARPALEAALVSGDARARAHAEATIRLCEDPESTFFMDTRD